MSELSTGYRLIPAMGSTNSDTTWTIGNLAIGNYYWSVQTIDNAFGSSAFSPVQTFAITTTGIGGKKATPAYLYPNPVTHSFWIAGIDYAGSCYSVYDLAGKRVKSGILQSSGTDVPELPSGNYLLKITGKQPATFRFSIE
jgi:hypothetical protein